MLHMTSFASEKKIMQITGCTLNVQPANLHKQFKPMFNASWWHEVFAKYSRTSDNHFKKCDYAPLEWNGKTEISDDYISTHFQDTTLLCSLIFQKQESREMSRTNLTGLIRKISKNNLVPGSQILPPVFPVAKKNL